MARINTMNAYGSEEDSDTETGTHRGGDIACQPTVIRTLDRQLALDDQTRRVEYPQHSEWSGDTVNGQPTVANFNNATTATTVTGSVGVTTSTGTGTTGTTPTIAAAAPDAVPAPTTTRTGNCSTPAAGSAPAPDGVTAPMAMMQQLVTTVGDLGLRLNNLQTARTGAATSHQASAAPGPSTYQATTMRATPSTTTRAGLGTDVTACAVVPTTSIPQQVAVPAATATHDSQHASATQNLAAVTGIGTRLPPGTPGPPDDGYSSYSDDSSS
ncbi:hypothetical protein PC115_g23061 [Phytophthora cactorum]|uniref:Uncharacterized protein n=1 Tax=Phytophthora cactorum TaxID=29920 RepID=A0A8T1AEM4_9STRA|nr:hypothetical protein PC115_g23061 [Phytophthora cactorum]